MVRREDDNVLKKALMREVNGQRKRGAPRQTWSKQVEENVKRIGLQVEKAANRTRRREEVKVIAEG